jgi:hypothetical protein
MFFFKMDIFKNVVIEIYCINNITQNNILYSQFQTIHRWHCSAVTDNYALKCGVESWLQLQIHRVGCLRRQECPIRRAKAPIEGFTGTMLWLFWKSRILNAQNGWPPASGSRHLLPIVDMTRLSVEVWLYLSSYVNSLYACVRGCRPRHSWAMPASTRRRMWRARSRTCFIGHILLHTIVLLWHFANICESTG